MPPVVLGAQICAALTLALIVRRPLERRWVDAAAAASRPQRQFLLDLALFSLAALPVILFNRWIYGFPLLSSGLFFGIGFPIVGFFLSLNTALAREQSVITAARQQKASAQPPEQLYPLSRRFSWIAATATVCVSIVILLVVSRDFAWLSEIGQNTDRILQARRSVMLEVLFIMTVLLVLVLSLIFSYARNLRLLFDNQTTVLEQVRRGNLSCRVPVATQDEFGLIAGHTNAMILALQHRIKLLGALKMAEELQRSLLPHSPPSIPGLDISGTSRYCYETGGDYFDYLPLPGGKIGVIVADASDHGVGAALYMAGARAFLIAAASRYTDPAAFVGTVNRFLAADSKRSGHFITLFFAEIDPAAKTLAWVRAGHEPAVLFNPAAEKVETLGGRGIALGVTETAQFACGNRRGWTPGTFLVIGTDGIREARNPAGEMFGAERFAEVMRRFAAGSAAALLEAVIQAVADFQGTAVQEDDITLVVVKFLDAGA